MSSFTNMMIDIETLGHLRNSRVPVVTEIGVVCFNTDPDDGEFFAGQVNLSVEKCVTDGLQIDDIRPHVDEHYWLPLYGMSGAAENIGWKPQPGNPGRLDAMRPPLPCWAVFTEGHITAKGELAACCFGNGIDGGLVMADLTKVDFLTGWNSEAYQKLRAAHLAGDVSETACSDCAAA